MTALRKSIYSRLFQAILAAAAIVALVGLLAANLSFSSVAPSRESGRAGEVATPPAAMKISPAAVIERNAPRFIGTGDGSAGSWLP